MFKHNYHLIEILILCWIIYLCESKYQDANEVKRTALEKLRRITYPTYSPPLSSSSSSSLSSSASSSSSSLSSSSSSSSYSSASSSSNSRIGGSYSSSSSSSNIDSSGSGSDGGVYNQKIMKNQLNTGNPNLNLCSQDRSRKLLCYCLPNGLTKNGRVTKADCWIFQKNLHQNDTIWLAFNQQKSLRHIKFTVQPTGYLDYIPTEYLKQLHNLTTITIEYAQITIIHGYSFGNLPNLLSIELQNNEIQILDQNSFVNHEILNELHLENNNIHEIDRYSFRNLPILKKLYFQSNNLSHLNEDIFCELGKLEELDISYNYITVVTTDIFKGLGSLRYLKLTRNNLISIGDTVFAELWSLSELELDDNNIERISQRAFDGLNTLKVLNLRGNRLKNLDNGLLRGTPALLSINLQENLLETLTVYCFEPIMDNLISKNSELLLTDNNFVCDCRLQWVFDLKNRTKNEKMKTALDEIECTMFDTKYQQFQTSSSSNDVLLMNSIGSSKSITPESRKGYFDHLENNNNNNNNNNNHEHNHEHRNSYSYDDNNGNGGISFQNENDNVMDLTKLNVDLLPCPAELKEPTELPMSRESIRISDNREPQQFLNNSSNCQSTSLSTIILINLMILLIKHSIAES